MGVAVEFLRVDAVLHEHKPDVLHVQIGFLLDFAAEGGFGGFAPFDFAAGNAPEVGPFVSSNHEHFAGAVENERADGGFGRAVWIRGRGRAAASADGFARARAAIRPDARQSSPVARRAIGPGCCSR